MREVPTPHMGFAEQLARFGRFGDDRPHRALIGLGLVVAPSQVPGLTRQ
jgi:hypothetical protein